MTNLNPLKFRAALIALLLAALPLSAEPIGFRQEIRCRGAGDLNGIADAADIFRDVLG